MTRRRLVSVVLAGAVAFAGGACGDETKGVDAGTAEVKPLADVQLPPEVLGLAIMREDIAGALGKVQRTYVEEAALFSLRTSDEVLQATLQVNRFGIDERYRTARFRNRVVSGLGSTPPRASRMGDDVVWRTTATKQVLAVWFDEHTMFVLAIRDDFPRPRALIRSMVEMELP